MRSLAVQSARFLHPYLYSFYNKLEIILLTAERTAQSLFMSNNSQAWPKCFFFFSRTAQVRKLGRQSWQNAAELGRKDRDRTRPEGWITVWGNHCIYSHCIHIWYHFTSQEILICCICLMVQEIRGFTVEIMAYIRVKVIWQLIYMHVDRYF